LRHPWTGGSDCPASKAYQEQLAARKRTEAETLASLTSWDLTSINQKMGISESDSDPKTGKKWYQKIWKN
jgi:hypothetical protein